VLSCDTLLTSDALSCHLSSNPLENPPMRLHFLSIPLALLILASGCDSGPSSTTTASVKSKPKMKTRETLNKRTQRVFELSAELKKGAVIDTGRIDNYDPLSGPGRAYVATTGRIGEMAVQQALEIYNVQNEHYPRTFQEFIDEVMQVGKPDGIMLPERPYYQEYAYDVDNHRLVVLTYPERKAQFQKEQDERFGRQ
jgi:hypothetical protein